MKTVAIQGEEGSFHYRAVTKFFNESVKIVSCTNFKSTFQTLQDNNADYAVVAIENSLYGSINEVYDLLIEHDLSIVGEEYLRVEFCLIGTPDAVLNEIEEVHSQVFALSECEDYLNNTLPNAKRFEEHDTAGSVALIKKWGNRTKVAIASEEAAKLHDMKILAQNIETHHENYTRFIVLSKRPADTKHATKATLVLTTKADTKPGALLRALQVFADHNINMTMLQSRPIIGKAWHYMFYIDIEFTDLTLPIKTVVSELETTGCHSTVLGCYASGRQTSIS